MRDEGVLAFSCWIFPTRTPVRAARNGWLELPDDVVCLENSITAESHRGRGIAPATWARLADDRAVRGMRTMVTKVATDNVASLRAAEKAGFREIATMEFRRRGPVEHVTVAPSGDPSGLAQELAARLDR